jgi:hypothetical protein
VRPLLHTPPLLQDAGATERAEALEPEMPKAALFSVRFG